MLFQHMTMIKYYQKQIYMENSYISIHENMKSIYDNSSPIILLGLIKKTYLGNIHT